MSDASAPTAEVVHHYGRWHLSVHGVCVASEGDDQAWEPELPGFTWTKATLDRAAELINARRWSSASARWAEGVTS